MDHIFNGLRTELKNEEEKSDHIKQSLEPVLLEIADLKSQLVSLTCESPSTYTHLVSGARLDKLADAWLHFHALETLTKRDARIWTDALQESVHLMLLFSVLTDFAHNHTKLQLRPPGDVASALKVPLDHINAHVYLHAVLDTCRDLVRMAVSSVLAITLANAKAPGSASYKFQLSVNEFIKELQSGFMLLNLRNDSLRRHTDSLKYEARRIEGVIYDLAIRNLLGAVN